MLGDEAPYAIGLSTRVLERLRCRSEPTVADIVARLAAQRANGLVPERPEIVSRIRKHHHAGLILSSPDPNRVEQLIGEYTERFYRDFYATAPPPERPLE